MIEIGSKVRCIANYKVEQDILICFSVGKLYTILNCGDRKIHCKFVNLKDDYGNVVPFVYDDDFYSNYLWNFFLLVKEDRKMKLEKLKIV